MFQIQNKIKRIQVRWIYNFDFKFNKILLIKFATNLPLSLSHQYELDRADTNMM